jgi:hypothetical protein
MITTKDIYEVVTEVITPDYQTLNEIRGKIAIVLNKKRLEIPASSTLIVLIRLGYEGVVESSKKSLTSEEKKLMGLDKCLKYRRIA